MTSYSLDQIAEQLIVSLRTVHQWVADGELRAISVSRSSRKKRLRILQSDLDVFLAGRAVGGEVRPQRRARRKAKPIREYV